MLNTKTTYKSYKYIPVNLTPQIMKGESAYLSGKRNKNVGYSQIYSKMDFYIVNRAHLKRNNSQFIIYFPIIITLMQTILLIRRNFLDMEDRRLKSGKRR